jgi:hypothetical protein
MMTTSTGAGRTSIREEFKGAFMKNSSWLTWIIQPAHAMPYPKLPEKLLQGQASPACFRDQDTMQFTLHTTAGWFFCLLLGLCGPAQAQHLYKCGAAYQDRPCDAEVQQRLSASTGEAVGESYNPRSSAACARQGASAKAIAEKHRAGVSLESALAAMQERGVEPGQVAARQDFVRSVYQHEGTPPAVARQIEDECVAQWPSASDYRNMLLRRVNRPRPPAEAAATAAAAAQALRNTR